MDHASLSYINKKVDIATSLGIKFKIHQFLKDMSTKDYFVSKICKNRK